MTIGLLQAGVKGQAGNSTGEDVADTVNALYESNSQSVICIRESNGVDDSAEFSAALLKLQQGGGGALVISAGTYIVENLPIYSGITVKGFGWDATKLQLKAGSTGAIFKRTDPAVLNMFNVQMVGFYGNGRTGGDGLDASAASLWVRSAITDCWFQGFKRGVVGTQNDRQPIFTRVHYIDNDISHYVIFNHPYWIGCNFRDSRIGIGGISMYDSCITNTIFAYNGHGIFIEGGDIDQINISNSIFFTNTTSDAVVNTRVSFSNCIFASGLNSTTGVTIIGSGNILFNGCIFKKETASYSGECIKITSASGTDRSGITIQGCVALDQPMFLRSNCPSLTNFNVTGCNFKNIPQVFSMNHSQRILDLTISSCSFSDIVDFAIIGQTAAQNFKLINNVGRLKNRLLRLSSVNTNDLQSVQITGNAVNQQTSSDLTATDGVIQIDSGTSGTGCGYNVSGNSYRKESAHTMNGFFILMKNASNSIIKDNIISRSGGISLVTTNVNTKNIDNIHIP